jgi:hypothetical protein
MTTRESSREDDSCDLPLRDREPPIGHDVRSADEGAPEARIWASQWYRITPRSFVQTELFFDPQRVLFIFVDESYKSFLLRKDGREDRARELGKSYRERSAQVLLADKRHEESSIETLETIALRSGSWLRKPKLEIVSGERSRTLYHSSRGHDVEELATSLAFQYPSLEVRCDGERVSGGDGGVIGDVKKRG